MNLRALIANTVNFFTRREQRRAEKFQDHNQAPVAKQIEADAERHEEFKDANPLHRSSAKMRRGGVALCSCDSKKPLWGGNGTCCSTRTGKLLGPIVRWCRRHRAYVCGVCQTADRQLSNVA